MLTEYDLLTKQERPVESVESVESVYEVTIKLEPRTLTASARSYRTGRVRIDCGRSTLFNWGKDSLLRYHS